MDFYSSSTYIEDLRTAARATVHIEGLKGKTVLITGSTGTIGSFIIDLLMQYNQDYNAEIKIYAAGRKKKYLSKRFAAVKTEQLCYVEYDLFTPIDFSFPVDYIIHGAGNAYPAAFNGDPVGTIMGNVAGTYALLEYGKMHGAKRLLYVSSGEVYGQGDLQLEEFDENYAGYLDSMDPRSCYPSSKRTTETLCVSYSKQHGMETVIVRPCHTYGPCMSARDNRANVQFMNNVIKGEDIILKSSGSQMRSYCYVADCASAVLTVLLNGKSGEAYNSANPEARITIAELAQIIAESAGRKVVFVNPTAEEIADRTPITKQVLSSKKLEGLGWEGRFSVRDGIEHTLTVLKAE